jgi:glucose/arabinose dehydrogenase
MAILAGTFLLLSAAPRPARAAQPEIRIHAGGPQVVDASGKIWKADQFYSGGFAYSTPNTVTATLSPALYQTERAGAFSYHIPVEAGSYRVTLHFAEIYFKKPGSRVFSVLAEGAQAVPPLDIAAAAGPDAALQRSFELEVNDGSLDLVFLPLTENAKLSALEVIQLGAGAPPALRASTADLSAGPNPMQATLAATLTGLPDHPITAPVLLWKQTDGPAPAQIETPAATSTRVSFQAPGLYTFAFSATLGTASATAASRVLVYGDATAQEPVRIRAGGAAYTDSAGSKWMADAFFKGGSTFAVNSPVHGTPDPALYQSERYGTFGYHVPLKNGIYSVRVHLAEIWFKSAGSRVFNISAEAQPFASSFDVCQSAGYMNATVLARVLTVADGVLDLEFTASKDFPKLSALEILPVALASPPLGVDVGQDRTLQLPLDTLQVQATLPAAGQIPQDASCLWSQTAGPHEAEILSPDAFLSQIHFHEPGLYTFKATVTAGDASGSASVSIKVLPAADTPGTLRIRCGGGAYTDAFNRPWAADAFFAGGSTYSTQGSIGDTSDPALYLAERCGAQFSYKIPVANGDYTVRLHFAEIYWKQPKKRLFSADVEGVRMLSNFDPCAAAGPATAVVREMQTNVSDGVLNIGFQAQLDWAKVSAIEVLPLVKADHFLHAVIRAPEFVVDYAGVGSAPVTLSGTASHTHEFGRTLARYEWTEGPQIISTEPDFTLQAPLGKHTYFLTIYDNNTPPASLSNSVTLEVAPASAARGATASYFVTSGTISATDQPAFLEVLGGFKLERSGASIQGSDLPAATVRMQGLWTVSQSGTYSPAASPGVQSVATIDGKPWTGPVDLAAGPHMVVWQVSVTASASLPAELSWKRSDGASGIIAPLTHDEASMAPQINRMPLSGPSAGGDLIEIRGLAFFPAGSVSVLWGTKRISGEILESDPFRLLLVTPPGSGTVPVRVQTQRGESNSVAYRYVEGTAPVQFQTKSIIRLDSASQAAWGPDGRLYIATISGTVTALELDDEYNVLSKQLIPAVQNLPNSHILGIGFSPWETAASFRIYIGHARLYINDGRTGIRPAPYIGQVSSLQAPLFAPVPLITGLPSSNHDHGVNGISFDNRGQLYVPIGGNTNAGVPNPNVGGFDESPLSETILVASLRDPAFDGAFSYTDSRTGLPSPDQNDGRYANLAGGNGVRVFASGFRNAFDLVWGTNGFLYATDNGPNVGFGKASLTENTEAGDPNTQDKVLLVGKNHYHGHANRNRGRFEPRENRYYYPWDKANPELYTQPLIELPSSKDGIDEYRANAFGGSLRGSLLVQEWNGFLSALKLSADGRTVESFSERVWGTQRGLDVVCGPGGAIVVVDYSGGQVNASLPEDKNVTSMTAYDVFPWRAPASGGFKFVIGGKGFGALADTTVRFGTLRAELTSVTPRRIKGFIPACAAPTAGFLPLQVQSAGGSSVISDAFRYLLEPGQGKGVWREESQIPTATGRATAAECGGLVYVLSEDSTRLQAFDTALGDWFSNLPPPPAPVENPSLVSIGQNLVLVGSAGGDASWVVQIYSPFSRTWSRGSNGPMKTKGPAVVALGSKVYVCGGLVEGSPGTAAASYDVEKNQWTALPQLPIGCSEAAATAADGMLRIFGGEPLPGPLTVQVFDIKAGAWTVEVTAPGQDLPNRLGAAAVTFAGECYLLGGRLPAGEAVSRVDAYLPSTRTWRADSPLPEAAWGVAAASGELEIFTAGGRNQTGQLKAARQLVR